MAVLLYFIAPFGSADRLDAWWLAARFSLREKIETQPTVDPDIVLVTLDDACADVWKEPMIGWGGHIAAAVEKIALSQPKVIAFDYLPVIPTDKYFPGNDEKLAAALSKTDRVVWTQIVRSDKEKTVWVKPYDLFLFANPKIALEGEANFLGYAELVRDKSVVMTMFPIHEEDENVVSFAGRVAEQWYEAKSERDSRNYWIIRGKREVPLRADKTILPDFRSGTGLDTTQNDDKPIQPFLRISLRELTQDINVPDPRLKGKIVVFGEAMQGSNDSHFVPFLSGFQGNRLSYGIEIQANFIRALIHGKVLAEPTAIGLWCISLVFAVLGSVAILKFHRLGAVFCLLAVGVIWAATSFFAFVQFSYALPFMVPMLGSLLSAAAMGTYLGLSEEKERRQVLGLWGRYQDPRLVNYLLHHPEARGGSGEVMTVTVLFADLVSFTKTVEMLSPTETLQALNRYLELLERNIREKHGGVVDKYLGDGLLAQWGAPLSIGSGKMGENARAAIAACTDILEEAQNFRTTNSKGVHFGLRLTLHTGTAIVGWVGGERVEYTIIGDTVNVASRLQEAAKAMDCDFLISETTYAAVNKEVPTGRSSQIEIRGRVQPLWVYEVVKDGKSA